MFSIGNISQNLQLTLQVVVSVHKTAVV